MPFYFETKRTENLEDIQNYLKSYLSLNIPDEMQLKEVAKTILEKSEGIFLYVKLVLLDLRQGNLILDKINDLPLGLAGMYWEFFNRQFPKKNDFEKCRPLLEILIAAHEPLSLSFTKSVLKLNQPDLQTVLDKLSSLLIQSENNIQLFHHSLVDWLTNSQNTGIYFVDTHAGHKNIADSCWNQYRTGIEKIELYCLAHLPSHLLELERWEQLLELVMSPDLGLIRKWVDQGGGNIGLIVLEKLVGYLKKTKRYPTIQAGFATQIARIYSIHGKYNDTENWLKNALEYTFWWKNRRIRAIALHELGSLSLYQGNFPQAKRQYRQALRLCQWGIPIFHDEIAANLIGLANVFVATSDFSKAINCAKKAIRKADLAKDFQHGIAGNRLISVAYKMLGQYIESKLFLQEAMRMSEKYDVPIEKSRLLLLLGSLQYKQATKKEKIPREARNLFQNAKVEAQCIGSFYCLSEANLSLAQCMLVEGNNIEAEKYLMPLQNILSKEIHLELWVRLELGMAAINFQRGNLKIAKKRYQQIIHFCCRSMISFNLVWYSKAQVGLGAIYWHTNEHKGAEIVWKQALQTSERISRMERSLTEISIKLCKTNPHIIPR